MLVPRPQQQHNWPMYIVPADCCRYIRYNNGFLQYIQSSVNPNVFINGTASQWAPTSTSYPVQATTVNGVEK
eukprot:6268446-Ditylum_brightwellii.AAC.1